MTVLRRMWDQVWDQVRLLVQQLVKRRLQQTDTYLEQVILWVVEDVCLRGEEPVA